MSVRGGRGDRKEEKGVSFIYEKGRWHPFYPVTNVVLVATWTPKGRGVLAKGKKEGKAGRAKVSGERLE